jgi:hypothetical protein
VCVKAGDAGRNHSDLKDQVSQIDNGKLDAKQFNFPTGVPSVTYKVYFPSADFQFNNKNYIFNSGVLVSQRTLPTKRPPLVGEVNANFSG